MESDISRLSQSLPFRRGDVKREGEEELKQLKDELSRLDVSWKSVLYTVEIPDDNGKTNQSLADVKGNILCVSQFTLYASVKEGNRPSFTSCMKADDARVLYGQFFADLKEKIPTLQGGVFQADMVVSLENDGPFTLILDSKELFSK